MKPEEIETEYTHDPIQKLEEYKNLDLDSEPAYIARAFCQLYGGRCTYVDVKNAVGFYFTKGVDSWYINFSDIDVYKILKDRKHYLFIDKKGPGYNAVCRIGSGKQGFINSYFSKDEKMAELGAFVITGTYAKLDERCTSELKKASSDSEGFSAILEKYAKEEKPSTLKKINTLLKKAVRSVQRIGYKGSRN